MRRFFILFFLFFSTSVCWASGCYSTYLEGTQNGYGKVPLYSTALLLSSSVLLATEGGLSKSQKRTADIGFGMTGIYLYLTSLTYCRSVNKQKYAELSARKKSLLEKDPNVNLPFELKYLQPIPSEEEYKNQIEAWKISQKRILFLVGGLNSALLFVNAKAADEDGVKIFSYLSIAAIVGMSLLDVDNLWSDKNPRWADFQFSVVRIDSGIVPAWYASYRF